MMKAKRYRIYGSFFLICAIGLSINLCTYANSKISLSDMEMSSIFGGVCGPCDDKGTQGCKPEVISPSGSPKYCASRSQAYCSGGWSGSCRQDEKECQNEDAGKECANTTTDCLEQYQYTICIWDAGCKDKPGYPKWADCNDCGPYSSYKDWCEGEE